jgi:hypothetical protein
VVRKWIILKRKLTPNQYTNDDRKNNDCVNRT